ncbi:hypothetical protein ASPSYDRAFT_42937 [Aspergillus sydowii CBS 593.65]|uniref:Uncharacterized protein n=1 Tax=Aspergillus sydowii CBS 593.65 TaxID=1036612 RepID=A0A1L9TP68_9EURO|nr:uncharacterized protein ASPSYDRAFT_42937 [Aspergillus sydowii CBS 593.65]OJJ61083.1 hypothetical protein ASPSYDRAFT_42937 [Aspergillus sydowii CBS 593.65]
MNLELAYSGYPGYPFAASGRTTIQSPTSGVNPVVIGILCLFEAVHVYNTIIHVLIH